MSVSIAGRTVKLRDTLYHTGFRAWGEVVGFDTGSAKLKLTNGDRERVIYVHNGGTVNGVRAVYWHAPLQLDLPVNNIEKFQRMVNALAQEFG